MKPIRRSFVPETATQEAEQKARKLRDLEIQKFISQGFGIIQWSSYKENQGHIITTHYLEAYVPDPEDAKVTLE